MREDTTPNVPHVLHGANEHRETVDLFRTGTSFGPVIEINREKGHPDFSTRELAFIRRVAPHLGAVLRATTLQQALDDDQDSDDAIN